MLNISNIKPMQKLFFFDLMIVALTLQVMFQQPMQPMMVQDPNTGQMVMMQPVAMGQPGQQQMGQPGQQPAPGQQQGQPQVGGGHVQMGAPVADPNAKRQPDPREKDGGNGNVDGKV